MLDQVAEQLGGGVEHLVAQLALVIDALLCNRRTDTREAAGKQKGVAAAAPRGSHDTQTPGGQRWSTKEHSHTHTLAIPFL